MPNKYSHALVLSHYESRGLISFPSRYQPQPVIDEALDPEPTLHLHSSHLGRPSSPPRTPLPPLPPLPPITHHDEEAPSSPSSHRSTPSTITEIYAPKPLTVPLPPTLPRVRLEPQEDARRSPPPTTRNSLTSEASSAVNVTPRTSVSSVKASPRIGDNTGDSQPSRSSPDPPTGISNHHETRVTSDDDEHAPKRDIDTDQSLGFKSFEAFIDSLSRHSFFYTDKCSTRPGENRSGTPPILRLQSHPLPGSSCSSSPDEAAPPPISRHRRGILPATTKPDRFNLWVKPTNADRDSRHMPHTIRDLTPEVTPWESSTKEEEQSWVHPGQRKRIPDALPGGSNEPTVHFAAVPAPPNGDGSPTKSSEKSSPKSFEKSSRKSSEKLSPKSLEKTFRKSLEKSSEKSSPKSSEKPSEKPSGKKMNRLKRLSGYGGKKAARTENPPPPPLEKMLPRVEGERPSRAISCSEEEFIAQFERDGYFWR